MTREELSRSSLALQTCARPTSLKRSEELSRLRWRFRLVPRWSNSAARLPEQVGFSAIVGHASQHEKQIG